MQRGSRLQTCSEKGKVDRDNPKLGNDWGAWSKGATDASITKIPSRFVLISVLYAELSSCQPLSLLLHSKSRLKKPLSCTGQQAEVKLLLNQFIRLEEYVSSTGR